MSTISFGTASSARMEEQRRAWLQALLVEERRSRPSAVVEEEGQMRHIVGPPTLRVSSADKKGVPGSRWNTDRDTHFVLHAMLASETIADIGDHTEWPRTVRDTHAIWDTLNDWRMPYLGALSAGVGTHTHIFIGPVCKHSPVCTTAKKPCAAWHARKDFMDTLIGAANWHLGGSSVPDEGVALDPKLVTPNYEAHLVREFGALKQHFRKTLWTTGPGPYRPLPLDRSEAYRVAGVVIPKAIQVAEHPPGPHYREIAEALGGLCPRGPQCYPGDETDLDGLCANCPVGM